MENQHLGIRVEQCLALVQSSNCTQDAIDSLLLDTNRNFMMINDYNIRTDGSGERYDSDTCLRDSRDAQSGIRMKIHCHHTEMNMICNSAASDIATLGAWMFVVSESYNLCSILIHHGEVA